MSDRASAAAAAATEPVAAQQSGSGSGSPLREAAAWTVTNTVQVAQLRAVAVETKVAAGSAAKELQTMLRSLKHGAKHASGLSKIAPLIAQQHYLEETSAFVSQAAQALQGARERGDAVAVREAAVRRTTALLREQTQMLNVTWSKLMTPGGAAGSAVPAL